MLIVNYKQVYEIIDKEKKQWILIIYSISANHYVGVPVYTNKNKKCIYLKSINKYADINKIDDYNISRMNRCIYLNKKPLKLNEEDYCYLIKKGKNILINFLNTNVSENIDGISYLKWCRDKYLISNKDLEICKLKQGAIYWTNFGINVGSELRKLRPAILWRSTGDKKLLTMIPLSTKKREDDYYFHYDVKCLSEGTAKIENMMNLSSKRILAPYFSKNKLAIITKEDYENIKNIMSRYYLFK